MAKTVTTACLFWAQDEQPQELTQVGLPDCLTPENTITFPISLSYSKITPESQGANFKQVQSQIL